MLETFTLETFTRHLNSKFVFKAEPDDAVETELVKAQDIGTMPNQEQFSVIFRGPLDAVLQQGTYRVEHEELGAFDLFIVPVKQDEAGRYYEAIFNRQR